MPRPPAAAPRQRSWPPARWRTARPHGSRKAPAPWFQCPPSEGRIEGVDGGSQALRHTSGIAGRPHGEARRRPRALPERHVHRGEIVRPSAIDHRMEHTDDLPFHRRSELGDAGNEVLDEHALLERIDIFQVALTNVSSTMATRGAPEGRARRSRGRGWCGFRKSEIARGHHLEALWDARKRRRWDVPRA